MINTFKMMFWDISFLIMNIRLLTLHLNKNTFFIKNSRYVMTQKVKYPI